MKISPTSIVLHNTHQVTARCLHLPTQTHKAVWPGPQHLRISTPVRQRGAEPIRSNKLPLDRQRVDRQERAHSHHLQTTTGNSQMRSADRQVHSRSSGLDLPTVGVERTVQSVQQMFWKCLTTLHGGRAYVAVSRSAEEAERTKFTSRQTKKKNTCSRKTCPLERHAIRFCKQRGTHPDEGFPRRSCLEWASE
jgi:hypothetical protein